MSQEHCKSGNRGSCRRSSCSSSQRRTVHACTKSRWPTGEPSTTMPRSSAGRSPRQTPGPSWAKSGGAAAVRLDFPDDCVQCHPCSRGRCDDIQIIQKRGQLVCWIKGARCLHQGTVPVQRNNNHFWVGFQHGSDCGNHGAGRVGKGARHGRKKRRSTP